MSDNSLNAINNDQQDVEYDIPSDLALEIVDKIFKLTGYKTIVCKKGGVIIGATDRQRIGTVHSGSKAIMEGKIEEAAITAEDAEKNSLIREGLNLPISIYGKKIGTFGIGGKIEIVRPLCAIGADTIAVKIWEMVQKKAISELVKKITDEINHITMTILKISAASREAAEVASKGASVAEETSKKVLDTNQILEISHDIADQINLLGLNASIESARAGESGRGFAVVADKIQKLAVDSSDSYKSINQILKEIQKSIVAVEGSTIKTANLSNAQAVSIQEVITYMSSIQKLIIGLETSFNKE
jgi:sugar diacid utilization regulator